MQGSLAHVDTGCQHRGPLRHDALGNAAKLIANLVGRDRRLFQVLIRRRIVVVFRRDGVLADAGDFVVIPLQGRDFELAAVRQDLAVEPMPVGDLGADLHLGAMIEVELMGAAAKLVAGLQVFLPSQDVLFPQVRPLRRLDQEAKPLPLPARLLQRIGVLVTDALPILERRQHDAADRPLLPAEACDGPVDPFF